MNAQPYIDPGCNNCPANCHEYSFEASQRVKGLCGDSHPQGGCYGLIFVPYRNPSSQVLANVSKHVSGALERARS